MRSRVILLSLFLLPLALGCGPSYSVVPVSGTVTLDGKPLASALVLTQPIGSEENTTPGPGSFGETDDEGHFVLEMQHEPVAGAVPGEVWIKIAESGKKKASNDDTVDASVLRSRVPLDYQEGNKIKYTIPTEGTDQMNFDLKGERPQRR